MRGLAAALLALVLAGCSLPATRGETVSVPPAGASPTAPATGGTATPPDPDDPAYDVALSEPVEDSYYPDVGDPGVDALHYGLDLSWAPRDRLLVGTATVVFRATSDAPTFQLDLAPSLTVSGVTLDDDEVEADHRGKDLVVSAPVTADERYVLRVAYVGTPEPVEAPTTRSDFSTTGLTTTPSGEVWTMQEPYGAFTWYPVNDQPADKALYDFTLTVASPWVGIANGELRSREELDGVTTTQWHLAEPAASYLTTVAFGDYQQTSNTSASGVEIDYWVPTAYGDLAGGLEAAAEGLDWLEERLGPYPFDTLGFLLVDSRSGMETQTMITLGVGDYTTSTPVLVHEMAHHWYGDAVTPDDWRDVWMNEGMAMYLQWLWEAEQAGITADEQLDRWAGVEAEARARSGPPGAYDAGEFGESNVYFGPAFMWHELRQRLGDDAFWSMVRAWPAARDNSSTDREDYLAWIEDQTGEELTDFFDAWLLSPQTPARD